MNIKNIIMGCHTWCYVAIPQKQKDWRFGLVKTVKETKKYLKETLDDTTILKDASKTYQDHYQYNIDQYTKILQKETDQSKITEYKNRIEELKAEYNKWGVDCLIKVHQKGLDEVTKFLGTYKNTYLSDPVQFFLWWNNVPRCVVDNFSSFGLYIIKDNTIYREDKFGVTLKDYPISDSDFRIYDYEAKPCYSAQDCFDRCKEYNVELSEEKKNRILNWFKYYPDTIIEFG